MKKAIIIIIFLIAVNSGASQDIHFSQFKMAPVLINPAQAGFIFSRARLSANHRSQWRSVTVPFNTFSFSADYKLFQDRRSKNVFGNGITAFYDQAGDSKFGTSSGAIALSYIRVLNDFHNHFISFGASGSYNDRSYDYSELVFGNQFDGQKFDPDLYHGETFLNRGFRFFSLTAGIHWYYSPQQETSYEAGIVYSHINKPPQSMLGNDDIRLDRKVTLYFNAEILQPNKRTILPGFYFSRQGTYTEIIAGSMITLDNLSYGQSISNLKTGIFIRPVDAAILVFQFNYYDICFGISYDINYSTLRKASQFRGGFELSARYSIREKKSRRDRVIPCPDPF